MLLKKSLSGKKPSNAQVFKQKKFEDQCDFLAFCRQQLQDEDVGCYLNRRRNNLTKLWEYSVVYAFEVRGIHPLLYPGEAEATLRRVEQTLKRLYGGQRLVFRFSSRADDSAKQAEISELINNTDIVEHQYFQASRSKNIRLINDQGKRQHKRITVFAEYKLGEFDNQGRNLIEKALGNAEFYYHRVFGKQKQVPGELLKSLLTDAFNNGYLPLKSLLASMGLRTITHKVTELWEDLWKTFNPKAEFNQKLPGLGYHLVLEGTSLYEDYLDVDHSEVDPLSLAVGEQVPRAGCSYVQLGQEIIGAIGLEEKPAAFTSPEHQLLFLWEAVCNIPNCEIFCELSPSPQLVSKIALQRVAKESMAGQSMAAKRNNVSVEAGHHLDEAMDAQSRIYSGAVPINISLCAFLHRPTTQALKNGFREFEGEFNQSKWKPETDAAWMLWLNSLPVTMDALYNDNRRKVYLSDEAPALMPLVKPFTGDATGIEFITKKGRVPVHVDIYARTVGILAFGESRSGKTGVSEDIIINGLVRGLNVLAIDYPKPGGIHSLKYLAKMFGSMSAYVDVATEKNNLLQPPNPFKMASLAESDRQGRMKQHYDFCVTALTMMVMGNDNAPIGKRVRSLLVQTITPFFEHYEGAFKAAFAAGLGSPEWQQMPTLHHFLAFFEQFDFDMPVGQQFIEEASALIILELRTWLYSRVGQAISAPSTIDPDAQFTVFALDSVNDDIDAAIIALSAQAFMLRKAFELRSCISIVDEAPVLLKFEALARIVGMMCSNGMAAGIKPVIISQDPASITNSIIASQITNNLKVRFIGAITRNAAREFEKLLGYDPAVLKDNTTEQFFTNAQTLSSSWLVDIDSKLVHCDHYLPPEWLAALANNKSEIWLRDMVTARFENKYQAHSAFTKIYVEALRAGRIDYLYNNREKLQQPMYANV
ncbi:hypothetical protein S7335_968 [Synechococcus sp. PCC 7335]|uniref:hypothetical protein n=1 Tax=Synechococcus sp. (strain ATCC 29403 / PCC 7335) TaxID=91464 RepID=UPI00017ECF25|nr:hypothetical protein [Synechococcus sp. PCC 7335]EDX82667.1 hypothetical protein S7335_968 [Synechococcus sp. PCC 7335]